MTVLKLMMMEPRGKDVDMAVWGCGTLRQVILESGRTRGVT